MQYSSTLLLAALVVTSVFSHGTISSIEGATGASMAGFSSAHITRRNCASCRGMTETDSSISHKVSIADTEKIGSVTKIDEAEVEDATVTPSTKAAGELNAAAVGPLGGFYGVSRSQAEENRATELDLSKRHFARALANRNAEEDAPAAAAITELEKIGSATKDDEAEN